jgi:hypothetical protein
LANADNRARRLKPASVLDNAIDPSLAFALVDCRMR